jgi:hypothetical protein
MIAALRVQMPLPVAVSHGPLSNGATANRITLAVDGKRRGSRVRRRRSTRSRPRQAEDKREEQGRVGDRA